MRPNPSSAHEGGLEYKSRNIREAETQNIRNLHKPGFLGPWRYEWAFGKTTLDPCRQDSQIEFYVRCSHNPKLQNARENKPPEARDSTCANVGVESQNVRDLIIQESCKIYRFKMSKSI